jgi:hypothetical protein
MKYEKSSSMLFPLQARSKPGYWEVSCECGWKKTGYKNPVAAQWGGENHLPHCQFYKKAKEISEMAKKVFEGKTEDAGAFILAAAFWKLGHTLRGHIIREFQTENGACFSVQLEKPMTVPGDVVSPKQQGEVTADKFSIGGLKGFQMAVDASGAGKLLPGDVLTVKATGETDTGKGSPQVNFKVRVERGDANQQEGNF